MELALQFKGDIMKQIIKYSHNPCFYGISFAIETVERNSQRLNCHNPCFYGISFAIDNQESVNVLVDKSQSLFLWN